MLIDYLRRLALRKFRTARAGARSAVRGRAAAYKPRLDSLEDRRLPATFTWTNNAGGDWNDARNWLDDSGRQGVPGPGDTAVIATLGSVTCDDNAVGTLIFSGGNLTGGSLDILNAMTWTGGGMQGPGATRIDGGATLAINNSMDLVLTGRQLANAGTAAWSGSGRLLLNQGAGIDNLGLFDIQTGSTITATNGTGSITNEGTFRQSGGGTTLIDAPVSFLSSGGVDVQAGTLNLADSATLADGTVSGGGTLQISATTNWLTGLMEDGGQTLIAAGGVLNIVTASDHLIQSRSLTNAGLVNWPDTGTIALGGDAQITNQSGAVFAAQNDAVMATLDGSWTFLNQGLLVKTAGSGNGQTLLDAGSIFTNEGTVEIDSGTLTLAGSFTNFSADTLTLTGGVYLITGTFQFNDANIVTNAAVIVLDGPGAGILDQYGNNGLANFAVNAAGANFTLKDGAVFSTAGDFDNAGDVLVNDTSQLYVNGTYTQEGGTTTLTGSYLFAGFVWIQAGQLIGWGTVDSTLQNDGEVDVGGLVNPTGTSTVGTLTVTGDYTQAASGVLQIKLQQFNQYDRLAVGGTATLDGTLRVLRVDGFQPSFFDNFQILRYGGRSGDFATAIPPEGYRFTDFSYFDDQGFLNIALDLG